MATSDTRWMPEGRHPVNVGSSLGRALKARKLKGSEPATAKRSNLPDRDFYSFRCSSLFLILSIGPTLILFTDKFKPPSVDMTKSGTIEVKRGGDSSSVTVEYPGAQVRGISAKLTSHRSLSIIGWREASIYGIRGCGKRVGVRSHLRRRDRRTCNMLYLSTSC
jgi:hypothetical protein